MKDRAGHLWRSTRPLPFSDRFWPLRSAHETQSCPWQPSRRRTWPPPTESARPPLKSCPLCRSFHQTFLLPLLYLLGGLGSFPDVRVGASEWSLNPSYVDRFSRGQNSSYSLRMERRVDPGFRGFGGQSPWRRLHLATKLEGYQQPISRLVDVKSVASGLQFGAPGSSPRMWCGSSSILLFN